MNTEHPDQNPDQNPENTWESEMSDEFERRVRDLHEAPLDLSNVKGKAMNIRRKRRAAVAGGILAAAAVIVPVAVLATNGSADDAGIDPADNSSVTITETPTQEPTAVDTDNPTTPPPTDVPDDLRLGFDYLETGSGNAVLHESDGGTIELPGADYTSAADLGGPIAAFRQDENANGFVDVVEDGKVVTTYDVLPPMAITPTSSAVAFITTDGELWFVSAEGESSFGTGFDDSVYLGAIIGDGDCQLESGCHPFLNDSSGQTEPYEINYEGPNTTLPKGTIKVNDAADGYLVTLQTDSSDTGSCGGLYDRQTQEFAFETCDSQVLDISPTADYVIGTDPYGDGLGPGYFSILDASTGDEIARYAPEGGFVAEMAWADDTHAVATVYDGAGWRIVSLSVDGEIADVVGPTQEGDELAPPYHLTGGS